VIFIRRSWTQHEGLVQQKGNGSSNAWPRSGSKDPSFVKPGDVDRLISVGMILKEF
jgi:hypothetical protein